MPSVKRSKRIPNKKLVLRVIQTGKTSEREQEEQQEEVGLHNSCSPNVVVSSKRSADVDSASDDKDIGADDNINTREEELCFACCKSNPPIPRYKSVYWICCEACRKWWHIDCVCISKGAQEKFEKYEIPYVCVKCVLDSSPWCKDQLLSADKTTVDTEIPSHSQGKQKKTEVSSSKVNNPIPPSTTQLSTKPTGRGSYTVVVDNISDPKLFKSSIDIKKESKRFDTLSSIRSGFSLPCGGVALQFNTELEAEKSISQWPETAFGGEANPHRPARTRKGATKVGYIKNVDTGMPEKKVKERLKHCSTEKVERLFHRHTNTPMPVVRVTFTKYTDLQKAREEILDIFLNGKRAYVEQQRSFKVVRCFKCHRFGHVAKSCVYERRCEICASTEHSREECNSRTRKCGNCTGNHTASSTKCPDFIDTISRLRQHQLV
jgi:hypothetical protein